MNTVLKVENLNKSFGQLKAVNNLSFEVKKGELFAFLGQNGAGKSTTINMLIGTLERDSGDIIYGDNQNFKQFKNNLGVVFQNNIFDDNLTVEENIKLYGNLYLTNKLDVDKRYEELREILKFKDFEKKRFKTLSGGQKRRVEIARALFNNPKILFLDEPTTGLDPRTRIDVWQIINNLRKLTGMTVFLTTHYMEETADADYVVIIHNGSKITEGTPSELKDKYSSNKLRIVANNKINFERLIKHHKLTATKTSDYYEILTHGTSEEIDLINLLKSEIKYFELVRGSMDDVFLNAVGTKLEAE